MSEDYVFGCDVLGDDAGAALAASASEAAAKALAKFTQPSTALTPSTAAAMTAPLTRQSVGLWQRPVWQLALGGVAIVAITAGLAGLAARR